MKKRYLVTRIICFVLVCCMVLSSPISAKADDDGEDETDLNLEEIRAFDRHGKEMVDEEFQSTPKGEITYIRKHTKATSKINYATKYLIMSAKELSFSTDITMDIQAGSATKSSPYVIVPLTGKDNVTDYDEVITSYFFDNQELNTVAKKLGIRPAEGATTIDIYISHVFEISPAEESAWTSLRSRIGKISNSANSKAGNKNSSHYLTANKYDNGNDSLLWYRTMDEFVKPGGMSTFWSNGAANEKMYDCMNIKLQIAVNPKVYGIPVTVFYYDESTDTAVKEESFDDADLKYGEWWKYNGTYSTNEDGEYYIEEDGTTYIIEEGMSAYRTKKNYTWTGNLSTDADKTTKIKSSGIDVDFANQYYSVKNGNSKTKTIAMYIPVQKINGTTNRDEIPKVIDIPEQEDDPVKINVVYYDVKDKAPVKTITADDGTVGQKDYSIKIKASDCGEGYTVDTTGTVLAAHGSKKAVKTKYTTAEAAEQYTIKSFTSSKVVIESELVEAKYTAVWIPVKEGIGVSVHYIDESGAEIGSDNGGKAEKNKKYTYTVDTSKISSDYEPTPGGSYLENGGTTVNMTVSGSTLIVDKFPFDSSSDLYIPCITKPSAGGSGTFFVWNEMKTQGDAKILSDIYTVTDGIPSTEDEYAKVKAAKYLTKGDLSVFSGSRTYTISVRQWATRSWYEDDGWWEGGDPIFGDPDDPTKITGYTPSYYVDNDVPTGDSGWVTSSVTITLPWTYYTVDDYVLYNYAKAILTNGSVDDKFEVAPSYSKITATGSHSGSESDHVKDPAGYTPGMVVTLSGTISSSSSGYHAPSWPSINGTKAYNTVKTTLGPMQVRNDPFTFAGSTVMSGSWVLETDDHVPNTSKLVKSGTVTGNSPAQTIPALRKNLLFSSTGILRYELESQLNNSYAGIYDANVGVNSVQVHTPIVCDVTVTGDNNKYVQNSTADSSVIQLVVGRSDSPGVSNTATNNPNMTNDFTITFSNNGTHRSINGYRTRDYKKYLKVEQVQFPFDTIVDVNFDYNESNDVLVKAGDWYSLPTGTKTIRCYLPEWVAEGLYDVQFRSIALNGTESSPGREYANLSVSSYIATDSETVQVTGKMYGFTIYDIDAGTEWSDVFRLGTTLKYNYPSKYADGTLSSTYNKNNRYFYVSGLKNELGFSTGVLSKYGFPIVAGNNPKYKNLGVLKAGYTWRFKFDTVSQALTNDAATIKITPSFYWVDSNGNNRVKANLYYTENINGSKKSLVKIGSTLDATNIKKDYAGNDAFGINAEELKTTAAIRGVDYKTWTGTVGNVYSYGSLTSNNLFKTYSNSAYASLMSSRGLTGTKTTNDITKAKQTWYFEYSLPEFHAVPYNFDLEAYVRDKGSVNYKESFWLNDGYIIVNFDISAYDKAGNKIMSYSNEAGAATGFCNMFLTEFNGTNTGTKDVTDADGVTFNFYGGDVFMVYADPKKMISGDYSGDHLN